MTVPPRLQAKPPLCPPTTHQTSIPGGTGLTAGLGPGARGATAAGVGWGQEPRSGGWQETGKPVDARQV